MNLELIFKKALKFHLEGKLKIAEDLYKKIVKKKPDALIALNNLASIQNVKYNYNEAIKILRNVINLKPDYLEAINNNGIALNGIGNHEEAILNYEKALRLKPDFDSAINNLGKCQISLNLLEKASENFEKALKINPSNHKARWNLGFVQLLKGNFKDGWKNYEYRKRIKKNKNLFLADNAKEWFGTNIITNKSIYIYTEQGLGDYIQFSRYLILINKLGAKIILDTPQSLRNIIETIGVDFDYLEKLKIKQTKRDIQNLEKLLKQERKFAEKKERDREKFRLQLIKDIKLDERKKIYQLKDHLWKVGDRFAVIRQKYQEYRQKIREKQLEELEVRRKSREEARVILEAEKAENALKQKLVERLERFSRNMKSIVFQINKRYITKKRSPLRFIDNISESGECLIRNDDAPTDKDYLILLYIEGEDVTQRLKNPICLDDKTDIVNAKNFQPKDIFEASDYIIDRLAVMFDKERKLKK